MPDLGVTFSGVTWVSILLNVLGVGSEIEMNLEKV